MIIYPAIDLKDGHAVRLKQGRKEDVTIFSANPLQVAKTWQKQGATWLHIIDLDGAFNGIKAHAGIINSISQDLKIPVQVGGGIRTLEDAQFYIEAGASRLIIGTLALENPQLFSQMCETFPNRIGVSLDAQNGQLKTHGWQKDSGINIEDIIRSLEQAGTAFIIYTDIDRDGMHSGVNLSALERLLKLTSLPVIAAGGVSTLDDIMAVNNLAYKYPNLDGVISGRALYDGSLNLPEVLSCLKTL